MFRRPQDGKNRENELAHSAQETKPPSEAGASVADLGSTSILVLTMMLE